MLGHRKAFICILLHLKGETRENYKLGINYQLFFLPILGKDYCVNVILLLKLMETQSFSIFLQNIVFRNLPLYKTKKRVFFPNLFVKMKNSYANVNLALRFFFFFFQDLQCSDGLFIFFHFIPYTESIL